MNDSLWAHVAKSMEALSPLLLAALSWLSLRIAALINAKVKNERLGGILTRLNDAVFMAVREVEQVFVSMLKTASADGVLTSDERRDAKDAAVRAARAYLGAHGVSELCKVLGLVDDEVDRLLGARVEAAVFNLRSHPTRMLGSVLRSALTQAARTAPAAREANGAH
jgi:hypothetical protein